MDVKDNGNSYELTADLPGMKRGYEEMASINLSLAEENLWQDWSGGGCRW